MADQDDQDIEDGVGIALGFRIIDVDGKLHLAEAEVAPYVDAPDELGVTLVFHPLDGLNPVELDEELEWPSWPLDIDDDLSRDGSAPMDQQFAAIVRQLHGLSESQLKSYLAEAQADADEG